MKEYYIKEKNNKVAIFTKDKQVSDWFHAISIRGLLSNERPYYVGTLDNKDAIFDAQGNKITEWYNYIDATDWLSGKSQYYALIDKTDVYIYNSNNNVIIKTQLEMFSPEYYRALNTGVVGNGY